MSSLVPRGYPRVHGHSSRKLPLLQKENRSVQNSICEGCFRNCLLGAQLPRTNTYAGLELWRDLTLRPKFFGVCAVVSIFRAVSSREACSGKVFFSYSRVSFKSLLCEFNVKAPEARVGSGYAVSVLYPSDIIYSATLGSPKNGVSTV